MPRDSDQKYDSSSMSSRGNWHGNRLINWIFFFKSFAVLIIIPILLPNVVVLPLMQFAKGLFFTLRRLFGEFFYPPTQKQTIATYYIHIYVNFPLLFSDNITKLLHLICQFSSSDNIDILLQFHYLNDWIVNY